MAILYDVKEGSTLTIDGPAEITARPAACR
jgi:hypothetical protein